MFYAKHVLNINHMRIRLQVKESSQILANPIMGSLKPTLPPISQLTA